MKKYLIKISQPVVEEAFIEVFADNSKKAAAIALRDSEEPTVVWKRYRTENRSARIEREEDE